MARRFAADRRRATTCARFTTAVRWSRPAIGPISTAPIRVRWEERSSDQVLVPAQILLRDLWCSRLGCQGRRDACTMESILDGYLATLGGSPSYSRDYGLELSGCFFPAVFRSHLD